jgi:hypothetical protein
MNPGSSLGEAVPGRKEEKGVNRPLWKFPAKTARIKLPKQRRRRWTPSMVLSFHGKSISGN